MATHIKQYGLLKKFGKGIVRAEKAIDATKGFVKALPTETVGKILNSTVVNGTKKAVESVVEKTVLRAPKLAEYTGKTAEVIGKVAGKIGEKIVGAVR